MRVTSKFLLHHDSIERIGRHHGNRRENIPVRWFNVGSRLLSSGDAGQNHTPRIQRWCPIISFSTITSVHPRVFHEGYLSFYLPIQTVSPSV